MSPSLPLPSSQIPSERSNGPHRGNFDDFTNNSMAKENPKNKFFDQVKKWQGAIACRHVYSKISEVQNFRKSFFFLKKWIVTGARDFTFSYDIKI